MTRRTYRWAVSAALLAVIASTHADAGELGRRGMMGVQLGPPTEGGPAGAHVMSVVPDSAAAKAGLEANDVIVAINGQPISDTNALMTIMRNHYAGDTIKLEVLRGEEKVSAELTLLPRDKESSDEYQVIYDSAGPEGKRVRSIITKPNKEGRLPAVLFVQSLPPFSVEFNMNFRHPIKGLIDGLTNAGFVTMRVDRPGVGDSQGGDPRRVTYEQDVQAFSEGLKKLKTLDFVDPENVFVFAHSGGCVWAPVIAQSSGIKGLITYAALARPLPESFAETRRRNWELEALPDEEIKQNSERLQAFLKECLVNKRSPADLVNEKPELKELVEQMVQEGEYMGGLHISYYQNLAQMDPSKAWANVDSEILAIWGQSDFTANRTDSEQLVRWAKEGGKSEKAEFLALPGIDHSFNKSEDQEESYLSGFGGEFNPVIVTTVVEWMNKRAGKSET